MPANPKPADLAMIAVGLGVAWLALCVAAAVALAVAARNLAASARTATARTRVAIRRYARDRFAALADAGVFDPITGALRTLAAA